MIDFYPELSAYPEFVNVHNDNEIKIAIAISDMQSPFLKIKDPRMRINAIFEYLDIGLKSTLNQEFFERVLNYTDKYVFPACGRYLQMLNNHDFAAWWSLNIAYYGLVQESIKPMKEGGDAKKHAMEAAALSNQMDTMATKLKTYESRLFPDAKMKQKIVDENLKKIEFYPEKYAEKFPGFPTEIEENY
jgi:hypothetical protein